MTKKISILLLTAIGCIVQTMAQNRDIRSLEGEIGVGLVNGTSALTLDNCIAGPKLYGELRYNFRTLPLDAGVHISGSYFRREAEGQADRLQSKSYNITAVADYNFRRGKHVSFFAGVGIGCGILEMSAPISIKRPDERWGGYSTGDGKERLCFTPRVGVEFFKHLRVTLFYTAEEAANNHLGLCIGGVIGGGKKR